MKKKEEEDGKETVDSNGEGRGRKLQAEIRSRERGKQSYHKGKDLKR